MRKNFAICLLLSSPCVLLSRQALDTTGKDAVHPEPKTRYVSFLAGSDDPVSSLTISASGYFPDNTVLLIPNGSFPTPYAYTGPPNSTIAGVAVSIPDDINVYYVYLDVPNNWSATYDAVSLMDQMNTLMFVNRTANNASTNLGTVSPADSGSPLFVNADTGGSAIQVSVYASCNAGYIDSGEIIYNTYWPDFDDEKIRLAMMYPNTGGGLSTPSQCLPNKIRSVYFTPTIPIDISWESKDTEENPIESEESYKSLEGYPEWQKGRRYFPGKVLPDESAPRNVVNVEIKSIPGQTINLKSFDVADVTPATLGAEVDPNGTIAGNDNLTDYLNTSLAGEFVVDGDSTSGASANGSNASVVIPASGVAVIGFKVGMQPGNNYRIAGEPDSSGITSKLSGLQVATSGTSYVKADDSQISYSFSKFIKLSPMLTVWRKLHIEQDSMDAVPHENGIAREPDTDIIVPQNYLASASTTRNYAASTVVPELGWDPVDVDFYQDGWMKYHSWKIAGNNDSAFDDDIFLKLILTTAQYSGDLHGQAVRIHDDDGLGLTSENLPELPRFDLLTDSVVSKFYPAFIQIIDVAELDLNPNPLVDYDNYVSTADAIYNTSSANDEDDTAQYAGDGAFWSYLVVAGYQPGQDLSNDPNTNNAKAGEWINSVFAEPFTVVYVEGIREAFAGNLAQADTLPASTLAGFNAQIVEERDKVTAHEIGHGPESIGMDDHDEGGLMDKDYILPDFSEFTIKRFRVAEYWRD